MFFDEFFFLKIWIKFFIGVFYFFNLNCFLNYFLSIGNFYFNYLLIYYVIDRKYVLINWEIDFVFLKMNVFG